MTRDDHLQALKRAVEAGDTAAANEIAGVLESMDGPAADAGGAGPTIPEGMSLNEPGFFERSANTLGETWDKVTTHEGLSGDMAGYGNDPASRVREALSEGISGAASIVGDAAMSAGKAVLPQRAQDAIASGAEAVMGSAPVQAVTGAVGEFAQENPNVAKELGETVNIATALGGGPSAGVKVPQVKRLAEKNIKKHQAGAAAKRSERVKDSLMPDDLKEIRKGELDLDGGKKVWTPSEFQTQVIDAVNNVKAYNPKKSAIHNNTVLRKEVNKLRDKLDADIQRKGNPNVDMDALNDSFDKALQELGENPLLRGDAEKTAVALIEKMRKDMKGTKAADVLKARRDFDRAIKREVGDMAFDPDRDSAVNVAMSRIRNSVNEAVDNAVPGVGVRTSLEKQHHLLTAKDTVFKKAFKEADSRLGRVVAEVEKKLGVKFPTTPVAIGAMGSAAGGVAAGLAGMPGLAATLGAVSAAYAGGKGMQYLLSPSGRQNMWKAVKMMADNPMLKQERLLLVDLLESTTAAYEEARKENKE
jgi:hypothetical protein